MDYLRSAMEVLDIESKAILDLKKKLDGQFSGAVQEVLHSTGRVIVCGMGKSGIIGKKIASTLASTGTASFFMHPGEAYHGDLGMVAPEDVFLAISNSGETDEVVKLLSFLKLNGNVLIALTGNRHSTLGLAADCHLDVGVVEEACPLQLAPTSSTTAALAMGDALAVTLMQARDFRPEHFARFHPGGALGRRLLRRVSDEMFSQDLPIVNQDSSVSDVLESMSKGALGLSIVLRQGEVVDQGVGLITDGDIRRAIQKYGEQLFFKQAKDIMSAKPTFISPIDLIEDAFMLMEEKKITSLLVLEGAEIVGVFKK